MKRKEFEEKSNKLLEKFWRIENDFYSLVHDYYKDTPNEKGVKNSEFYKEMNGLTEDFERSIISMREKLIDPDSIQSYDTK